MAMPAGASRWASMVSAASTSCSLRSLQCVLEPACALLVGVFCYCVWSCSAAALNHLPHTCRCTLPAGTAGGSIPPRLTRLLHRPLPADQSTAHPGGECTCAGVPYPAACSAVLLSHCEHARRRGVLCAGLLRSLPVSLTLVFAAPAWDERSRCGMGGHCGGDSRNRGQAAGADRPLVEQAGRGCAVEKGRDGCLKAR